MAIIEELEEKIRSLEAIVDTLTKESYRCTICSISGKRDDFWTCKDCNRLHCIWDFSKVPDNNCGASAPVCNRYCDKREEAHNNNVDRLRSERVQINREHRLLHEKDRRDNTGVFYDRPGSSYLR